MDEVVKAAMAKWPTVPDCFGWLGLDARGDWYLRDDSAQNAGAFQSPCAQAKGSRLEHAGLIAFVGRNYDCDARGRWFFQNGPQRVYVELALAPWVWRLDADGHTWATHTGESVHLSGLWVDQHGVLYGSSVRGLGVVHSADMWRAADWLEQERVSPHEIERDQLTRRFGFVLSPSATR